jgi:hypothetical protein
MKIWGFKIGKYNLVTGKGNLSLAFDNHNAASAREKCQDINVKQSGLPWLITFSLIQAFQQ